MKRLSSVLRPSALAIGLSLGLVPASVLAQSTTGTLTGQAPTGATRIVIRNDSGLVREVPVDARGRYTIPQLPLGTYSVSLTRDGKTLETREGIALTVGASTDVSFADATSLDTVKVVGARTAAAIDVSSVDSRTVISAEQLAQLPLGRSSEAIALLAPGVVGNSANGAFVGPTGEALITFGGSSASENAYYINGFNTTDPLRGMGGLTLPYGAIDQQEIYTGGYSAKYGRSDGGVINAVGKRGSNDWHYGVQMTWEPKATRSSAEDVRYTSTSTLPATQLADSGTMYQPLSKTNQWVTSKSVYAGGPLLPNRLFFFGAYELQQQEGNTIAKYDATPQADTQYRYDNPRWYGKLDWTITDNHLLEITGASSQRKTHGDLYSYDYGTLQQGRYLGRDSITKTGGDMWAAKYTGYLTDNLTVSALYGKMFTRDYSGVGTPSDLAYLQSYNLQNPAYTGGTPITNAQTVYRLFDKDRGNRTENLRLDLNYRIGAHSITVGVDDQDARAVNQGYVTSGPGYYWIYGKSDPSKPISTGLGVPATGGFANGKDGYYVRKAVYRNLANVESRQRAQYVEDNWQVTDTLLLQLGLRLDQFTNYNANGDVYIKQSSGQWAPRVGFSWDVNGDASLKVYGNLGRYYLALPLNPALNAAGGRLSASTYYTYGGIDSNGNPTDLTALSGLVSPNNNFGVLPDPQTVTARGLKPSYQDEAILGFTSSLGTSWLYGAKATYRVLRSGVDDYCDVDAVLSKAAALGYTIASSNSCYLINPGVANTFTLTDTSGNHVSVPLSKEELGFPRYKRNYYALNLLMEHPFDGTWYARADYTFSRSYGTTEGQLLSTIGQTAVSTSVDWDFASLMDNSNGPQSNDHTHQLKLYGYYRFTPQWLVSANFTAISGAPKHCLGYYGADSSDPAGYGPYYHYCNGEASPPGKQGRLPWMTQLDLGATWRPRFGDGRLAVSANVFNVFNAQAPLWESPFSEQDAGVADPLYGAAVIRQTPRYLRLSVSYDY